MRIRGERECKNCGGRWSYYETGNIECPNCGSLHSVGQDEHTEHTASAATLDLNPARALLGPSDADTRAAADRAAEICREFTRGYGFIDAGHMEELDGTYVGALELRGVAGEIARRLRTSDAEERYFLALLDGVAEGERPPPADVPESFGAARGLAAAEATATYRREATTYLDAHSDGEARAAFATLSDHAKRVEALDGDVSPAHAETLLDVSRDLGRYLREGDEEALVTARDRLSRLG